MKSNLKKYTIKWHIQTFSSEKMYGLIDGLDYNFFKLWGIIKHWRVKFIFFPFCYMNWLAQHVRSKYFGPLVLPFKEGRDHHMLGPCPAMRRCNFQGLALTYIPPLESAQLGRISPVGHPNSNMLYPWAGLRLEMN